MTRLELREEISLVVDSQWLPFGEQRDNDSKLEARLWGHGVEARVLEGGLMGGACHGRKEIGPRGKGSNTAAQRAVEKQAYEAPVMGSWNWSGSGRFGS